jgi:UDP-glucose 4-epimerase
VLRENMRTGITGSSGFIGSYLTRWLAASGCASLRLLVRNTVSSEPEGAELCQGDLHSRADCERFVEGLQVIYYLAHENTPVNSDLDQPNDVRVNLEPLLNLLQAVQQAGTRPQIVYFSSGGAVYGRRQDRIPFRETDPCSPSSSYGILKLAAEQYLRLAADRGYLTATVLRVGNAYGALLPRHRMQGLIGVALSSLLKEAPIRVFGETSNVRDYVHLEDICVLANQVSVPYGPFTILNVGSGVGYSVAQVLKIVEDCHGSPIRTEIHPGQGRWLTDWAVLDISKAARECGWHPAVSLNAGIRAMMSAWHDPVHDKVVSAR